MGAFPTNRNADATRQRLLRSALELFTSLGFRATTTPLIAERAGVAEGSIYRHFRGKQHLYNETRRRSLEWAGALVRDLTADRPAAREALARIGRRLHEGAARDAPAVRMALTPPADGAQPDDACVAAAQAFRDGLLQVMAGGKSEGVVRAGPAELWCSIWLAVLATSVARIAAGDWTPDHPQAALTLDAAWDAVAARPSAEP